MTLDEGQGPDRALAFKDSEGISYFPSTKRDNEPDSLRCQRWLPALHQSTLRIPSMTRPAALQTHQH